MIQAAKRLDDAQRQADDKDALLAAVRLNWKLWTIIQADVLEEDSPLPLEVRQNLLNLSNFIDKHTIGIITEPDVLKLPSLIEINKNIAAGLFDSLRGVGEAAIEVSDPVSGDDAEKKNDKISTSA